MPPLPLHYTVFPAPKGTHDPDTEFLRLIGGSIDTLSVTNDNFRFCTQLPDTLYSTADVPSLIQRGDDDGESLTFHLTGYRPTRNTTFITSEPAAAMRNALSASSRE